MNTPKFEFPKLITNCKTLYSDNPVSCTAYLVVILIEQSGSEFNADMKYVAEYELDRFKAEYFYSHPEFGFWSKKQ